MESRNTPTLFSQPLFWTALLFFFCLRLYLFTLCPSFMDDDSAETIAAGFTLGLQHPPSYALDTLLVRLASFIPLGGPCFRVNTLTAFLASATVVLFALNLWTFLASRRDPADRLSQISSGSLLFYIGIGSLLLAFSGTYWEKALGAKGGIYILQMFLLQAFFYCFLRCQNGGKPSAWGSLALFLFGIGLTNHWENQVLFLPILVLGVFWVPEDGMRWRPPSPCELLKGTSLFLLGLSVLLFLPLRAHLHPVLDLGAPDQWDLFKTSMLRAYVKDREIGLLGTFMQWFHGNSSWAQWSGLALRIWDLQGPALGDHLVRDMKIPALVLACLGMLALWQTRSYPVLLFLLVPMALLYITLLCSLWVNTHTDFGWLLDNYLLITNAIVAFLAVVGMVWTGSLLPRNGLARGSMILALALLPLWLLGANFKGLDLKDQMLRYDYGSDLLKSLPRDSVFFAEGDPDYFPCYYFQLVEGLRPDVAMIPSFTLFETWGVEQVERLHPELGLTASSQDFPDHFARIIYASSEIVVKDREHAPIAFSYSDGPFHLYYMAYHPSLLLKRSGILLELASPAALKAPALGLAGLRLRHLDDCPSNAHPSLEGIWDVYRLLGLSS